MLDLKFLVKKLTWGRKVSHIVVSHNIFLGKGVLKICRKFTGEHPSRNAILRPKVLNLFLVIKVKALPKVLIQPINLLVPESCRFVKNV